MKSIFSISQLGIFSQKFSLTNELKPHRITTAIGLVAVATMAPAGAQTFADFAGANGASSGTAIWNGVPVNWSISFLSNSNGENPMGGQTPVARPVFDLDLRPYTTGIDVTTARLGLAVYAGVIDNTPPIQNVGYDLTFTYNGGGNLFPTNTVFYLGDIDSGNYIINGSLGGSPLSVADWYRGVVQASSSPNGLPATWDGINTLNGQGQSTYFVHEFVPTVAFDTLTFQFRNGGAGDQIFFGIGDFSLAGIPEPSTVLLGALAGLGLILRRRRV